MIIAGLEKSLKAISIYTKIANIFLQNCTKGNICSEVGIRRDHDMQRILNSLLVKHDISVKNLSLDNRVEVRTELCDNF